MKRVEILQVYESKVFDITLRNQRESSIYSHQQHMYLNDFCTAYLSSWWKHSQCDISNCWHLQQNNHKFAVLCWKRSAVWKYTIVLESRLKTTTRDDLSQKFSWVWWSTFQLPSDRVLLVPGLLLSSDLLQVCFATCQRRCVVVTL